MKLRKWIVNVLVALDQLGNALLGGDPDETISSRTAKNAHRWPWSWLAVLLELIDPGHLEWSREDDEGDNAI